MYPQVPLSPYLCCHLILGCSPSIPQWSQIKPVPRGPIKVLNAAMVSLLPLTPFVLALYKYLLNTHYMADPVLGTRNTAMIKKKKEKRKSLLSGVYILGKESVNKEVSEYIYYYVYYIRRNLEQRLGGWKDRSPVLLTGT